MSERIAIAYALARHGPRRPARILDPAVGNGVLLEPFFRRFGREGFEAFAVDSDSRALKRVRLKFSSGAGRGLRIIQADFLEWACSYWRCRGELFDCVVMNPPFVGRRQRWRSLVGLKELLGVGSLPDAGPVEAGFVLGAIALLRPRGRLLAVLPASVMTSPSIGWVRGFMAGTGAIRHVHELPRFAFPEIESRICLVVYEKGGDRGKTLLLNHDLKEPETLVVAGDGAAGDERLDFGYHSARARFGALRRRASLGWCRLGELVTVLRGTEKTPGIADSVVHTGNYVRGFWRCDLVRSLKGDELAGGQIRPGDILVRRVSRNCARSFGLGVGIRGALASDCVLIVRPRYRVSSVRLLFAIRSLMALDFGPGLLERGTGASYLAQGELGSLEIPYGLSRVYRALFCLYGRAVRCRSFRAMQGVESRAMRSTLRAHAVDS